MIKREDVEIRNQAHLMEAEGSQIEKPTLLEINTLLNEEGYNSSGLGLWHDDLMGLWSWNCDIEKIK